MPKKHIPLITDIIDNIVLPEVRKRKYMDRQIIKILILSRYSEYPYSEHYQGGIGVSIFMQ